MNLPGVLVRVDSVYGYDLAVTVGRRQMPGLRRCIRWNRQRRRWSRQVALSRFQGLASAGDVERMGVTPAALEAFEREHGVRPRVYRGGRRRGPEAPARSANDAPRKGGWGDLSARLGSAVVDRSGDRSGDRSPKSAIGAGLSGGSIPFGTTQKGGIDPTCRGGIDHRRGRR
jgi:hypothetical protein